MREKCSEAIIYKMINYMDNSAIAYAFTKNSGKIKLFIPRAYTKKGGIMRFSPGELSYIEKETKELYKFVSFTPDAKFYFYHKNPDIICRLHVIFDFFDNIYDINQPLLIMWRLLLKFNDLNFRSVMVYTLYRIFKDSGYMFSPCCAKCNTSVLDMHYKDNGFICSSCGNDNNFDLSKNAVSIINSMNSVEEYRKSSVNSSTEKEIIKVFNKHINSIYSSNDLIKSLEIFDTISSV